jgi:hypothetical protein
MRSPLQGADGNVEFFLHASVGGAGCEARKGFMAPPIDRLLRLAVAGGDLTRDVVETVEEG